jgi:flagellar secretion chaperone FliS
MGNPSSFGTYQTVGTLTADPAQLTLMLFGGASRFLLKARRALERSDLKDFALAMSRTHAIIGELAESLNTREGGEVAVNLAELYRFMLVHLVEGQVQKSPAHIDRVLELLKTIREGFEGAVESTQRDSVS